jgi:pimeloyl-ACP methyl ester carboxylesterase
MTLPNALNVPLENFSTQDGLRVAFYADRRGSGAPVLLIHSINAAASSFELRPLVERFAGRRPVYCLDLPGFGHSDRLRLDYRPDLYARVIAELLGRLPGLPAHVLALSLSAEFAARAAILAPERVRSLVLVSPTGFSDRPLPGPATVGSMRRLLNIPGMNQWLYDLVASRRSIQFFLKRCFVGAVPGPMVDYAYATSHQPGARHAPLAFLSTDLFTRDATSALYSRLGDIPVLAIADQDPFISFERLGSFVAAHPNWRCIQLAPHKGLPHWERTEDTVTTLEQFWAA